MKMFLKSFSFAFLGIWQVLAKARNFRFMWSMAIMVLLLRGIFSFSKEQSLGLVFMILLVLASELFNESIERLCDLYTMRSHKLIKYIKDAAAGAVFLLSFLALLFFAYVIYENFAILWPWFYSFSSIDFILFFIFCSHQSVKGKSSLLDAASSILTLVFMAKHFVNLWWTLFGVLAFIIWQTSLILNTVSIHELKARIRKVTSSL